MASVFSTSSGEAFAEMYAKIAGALFGAGEPLPSSNESLRVA